MNRVIALAISLIVFISLALVWRRIASGDLPKSKTEKIRALFVATLLGGGLMLVLGMQGETDVAIIGGLALAAVAFAGYFLTKRGQD